jgi:hypothetical protein
LEIEPQTKLVDEEVKTIKMEIHVKIIEPQMGTKPLVIVEVEITKIIVKEINVKNIVEYIHFIFCHFPKISRTKSKVHKG